MAWYRTTKRCCDMFRSFAFGSKQFPGDQWKQTSAYTLPLVVIERRYHALSTNDDWRKGFSHIMGNDGSRNVLVAALAGLSVVGASALYLSKEEIPYSKRTHLVLVPRWAERMIGDHVIEELKQEDDWKVLPATHPMSVRVTLVTERVIKALERGLRDSKNWGGPSYASRLGETLKALWEGKESIHINDQIRRTRHIAQYFELLNDWKVMVVDDPGVVNCFSFSNGTIVMFTGLLELLESDAELAAVIGHEVAHGIARHPAEMTTNCLGLDIIGQFRNNFSVSSLVEKLSTLRKNRSLSVKHELEADYIGMLLMASAGYDPHAAVFVNKKLGELLENEDGDSEEEDVDLDDDLEAEGDDDLDDDDDDDDPEKTKPSTSYPSGKRRCEYLTQSLEEAMTLYKESMLGHDS